MRQDIDGKVRNHSFENGGSGHSKKSGKEGDASGGFEADGVPRVDAATIEHQVREDCAGVATEAGQLVNWNCAPGSGFMDSISLAEGLQLPNPKRGHSNAPTRG